MYRRNSVPLAPEPLFLETFVAVRVNKNALVYNQSQNTTMARPPEKNAYSKTIFLFLNKTYVEGAQKKRLNETLLFSTQNKC